MVCREGAVSGDQRGGGPRWREGRRGRARPRGRQSAAAGERTGTGTGRGRGVTGARGAGGSEEQSYIRSRARREARPERSIRETHSLGSICTHEAGRGPRSQREPWALRLLLTWARAAGQLRSYPKVMPRMRKTLCSPSLCVSRAPGRQACGCGQVAVLGREPLPPEPASRRRGAEGGAALQTPPARDSYQRQ